METIMFEALDVLPVDYIEKLPGSPDDIQKKDVEYFSHCLKNGKEEQAIIKFYNRRSNSQRSMDTPEDLARAYTEGLRLISRLIRTSDESLGLASLLRDNGRTRFEKAMDTLCSRTLVDADIQKFFTDKIAEESIHKKRNKFRSPLSPSSGGSRIGDARRRWALRRQHIKRSLGEPVLDRVLPPAAQAVLISQKMLLAKSIEWYLSTRARRSGLLSELLENTDVVDRWSRRSNNADEKPGTGSRRNARLRAELRRMQAFRMSIGQFGGHLAGYATLCMRQPFARSSSACLDAFEYCLSVATQAELRGGPEVDPPEVAREALVLLYNRAKEPEATATLEAFASTMGRLRMVVLMEQIHPKHKQFLLDHKVPARVLRYLGPHTYTQVEKAISQLTRVRQPIPDLSESSSEDDGDSDSIDFEDGDAIRKRVEKLDQMMDQASSDEESEDTIVSMRESDFSVQEDETDEEAGEADLKEKNADKIIVDQTNGQDTEADEDTSSVSSTEEFSPRTLPSPSPPPSPITLTESAEDDSTTDEESSTVDSEDFI